MKNIKRRTFLKATSAATIGAISPISYLHSNETINGKILVVLELSGGNDGLNTIVPYGDDNYYKHRPKIGIKENKLLKIDDYFGFNPGIIGLESLYKDGNMAIIHGCGYDNPSFSHFTSMAYMHTAAPNSGEEYGWLGRLVFDAGDNQLEIFDFFRNELPKFGWKKLSEIRSERSLLNYSNNNRLASIQIIDNTFFGSMVTITVTELDN